MNTVYTHENKRGGYVKFFPNEAKFHKDVDTGEVFAVGINSRGFRGAEFETQKPAGTIRVLTLGASSTFGMWNRDDETYPYQLQLELNQRCQDDQPYEVINFAIPHAVADQIRAMLLAEGLGLGPDVVTFYEGRNDSFQVHPATFWGGGAEQASKPKGLWHLLAQTLVTLRYLDQVAVQNTRFEAEQIKQDLDAEAERTSNEFILDLKQIKLVADEQQIKLILANQQANSKSWYGLPESKRLELKGVTYQDEVNQIVSLIDEGQSISGYEFNFLIHDQLMRDLEVWAKAEQIPFVDIIELLDQQRHHMVSWVHLDPYANKLVASAFADAILAETCRLFD